MANDKALIYFPTSGSPVFGALNQSVGVFYDKSQVIISSDLEGELSKGGYGLVVDTSPAFPHQGMQPIMPRIEGLGLDTVPRVESLSNAGTVLTDIVKIIRDFIK